MKRLLPLIVLLLCALPARAQNYVNSADSGAEVATLVSSMATGAFNLTAGNILACLGRFGTASRTMSFADTAGNTFSSVSQVADSTNAIFARAFWSVTTAGNASDVVTVTIAGGTAAYAVVVCSQFSWTGTLAIDASPAGAGSTSNSDPAISTAFSTVNANELILGLGTGFGGNTYAAGTIGGTTATLRTTNGTNGTNADSAIESRTVSATQSSITAQVSQGNNEPWVMFALSFKSTTNSARQPPMIY